MEYFTWLLEGGKNMKGRIIYFSLIIILILSLILTAPNTIDNNTLKAINKAKIIVKEMDIWPEYNLDNYPIAVRYGNSEFLLKDDSITKRKPVLEVFAMTAKREGDEEVIYLSSRAQIESIINITNVMTESDIEEYYISTIIHEGLHAKQLEENIDESYNDIDYKKGESIDKKLEDDNEFIKLYNKELFIIGEILEDKKDIEDYKKARANRLNYQRKILTKEEYKDVIDYQEYQELIEGTAQYAEVKSHMSKEEIIKTLKRDNAGNNFYYISGMGISFLMDSYYPNWKSEYGFSFEPMIYLY